MKKTLRVEGVHCKSCAIRIADAVSAVRGVKNLKVNIEAKEITFDAENDFLVDSVKSAIEKEGYKVI
jgi:copper chaperone CopZ